MPKQKLKNQTFTTFIQLTNLSKYKTEEIDWYNGNKKFVYMGTIKIEERYIQTFAIPANSIHDLKFQVKKGLLKATIKIPID